MHAPRPRPHSTAGLSVQGSTRGLTLHCSDELLPAHPVACPNAPAGSVTSGVKSPFLHADADMSVVTMNSPWKGQEARGARGFSSELKCHVCLPRWKKWRGIHFPSFHPLRMNYRDLQEPQWYAANDVKCVWRFAGHQGAPSLIPSLLMWPLSDRFWPEYDIRSLPACVCRCSRNSAPLPPPLPLFALTHSLSLTLTRRAFSSSAQMKILKMSMLIIKKRFLLLSPPVSPSKRTWTGSDMANYSQSFLLAFKLKKVFHGKQQVRSRTLQNLRTNDSIRTLWSIKLNKSSFILMFYDCIVMLRIGRDPAFSLTVPLAWWSQFDCFICLYSHRIQAIISLLLIATATSRQDGFSLPLFYTFLLLFLLFLLVLL